MKRLNKEYQLDSCNHILLKYGSVNKENPQVIYISGKCWISPRKNMNYENVMSYIELDMRKNIKNFFIDNVNFDKRFILDFDVNIDKLCPFEKKFLSFDLYLKQIDKNKKSLKELKSLLTNKVSTIANNLVFQFNDHNFLIEKRKNDL